MVYTAPLELQLLDVERAVAQDGDVVVQVHSSGICGSELEGIRSQSPFRVPPLVMGHEFGGIRKDTGERVVVNPIVSCGGCDLCLMGQGNLCRKRAVIGIHRPGAFAEEVAVPARCCHTLPEGMTWEQAALVEPIANAVHAWRLVTDRAPARIGIVGAGTIGLVALIVARWRGASEVAVADLSTERLAVAEQLGATTVGPALEGEFDVVFDAVGATQTRRASIEALRPGGAAVWLGLHHADPGFDSLDFTRSGLTLFGSFAYTDQDFRAAIGLAATIDPFWVTTFPLERGVEVFTELMNGRTDIVKAHLTLHADG
jgi:threonine dehydrogenase-like Zn-dependent dehydrogenase